MYVALLEVRWCMVVWLEMLLSCVYVALLEVMWCMVVWLEMLLSCVYVALLEVRWCMVVWWIQNMRQQQFHMVSAMPAL